MTIFSPDILRKFEPKCPFFTHPYQHWKTYSSKPRPDRVFDRLACVLKSVPGFEKRVKKARRDVDNPTDVFSFMTEMKVAYFLKRKGVAVEFSDADKGGPDLVVKDKTGNEPLYIEVNMPLKQYPTLIRMKEELQKINPYFQWERTSWLTLGVNESRWQEIYNSIAMGIKNKQPTQYIEEVFREGNLRGILRNDLMSNQYSGADNARGNPGNTVVVLLRESLTSKIQKDQAGKLIKDGQGHYQLKNKLNALRPNILWSEMLFLEDFQDISDSGNLPTPWGLPVDLDAQIIAACSINRTYGGVDENSGWRSIEGYTPRWRFVVLLNGKSGNRTTIENVVSTLLPNIKLVKLDKTAEELMCLEKCS